MISDEGKGKGYVEEQAQEAEMIGALKQLKAKREQVLAMDDFIYEVLARPAIRAMPKPGAAVVRVLKGGTGHEPVHRESPLRRIQAGGLHWHREPQLNTGHTLGGDLRVALSSCAHGSNGVAILGFQWWVSFRFLGKPLKEWLFR